MKKYFRGLKILLLLVLLFIVGKYGYDMYQEYQAEKEAEEEVITVACVGDSLTFSRSYTDEVHLYPTYLAEMLGEDYYVVNYGMAGSCVQGDLGYPYTTTRAYQASLKKEADIIIIMLGSNDVFKDNWRDKETFYKYYVELVDSYLQSENEPEIYLCTIPQIYVEDGEYWGYQLQEKSDYIVDIIKKVAKEKNLQLIDMNTFTLGHTEWYLGDGLHFNYEGTVEIAEIMYDALVDPVKVACVGDSVTFRHGFEEEPENNYPTVLSELLDDEYWVKNFGESGACVQTDGDCAYVDQKVYQEGLEFESDILIFMLGTNDSKDWNWKGEEAFRQAYKELLDSYINANTATKIYIGISPKAFYVNGETSGTAEFGIEPDIVNKIVEIQLEVAKERGYQVINIYELSKQHPEWFEEDGVHPTKEGSKNIANAIAEAILKEKE